MIYFGYMKSTGQLLSHAKCSVLLGHIFSQEDGEAVPSSAKVRSTTLDEKYLGLPISEEQKKMQN
jgi:hypothetical protein